MFVTVWKYLKDYNDYFTSVVWSRNIENTDNYFQAVKDDAEDKIENGLITGYLIKQFEINPDMGEMSFYNQHQFKAEKPSPRRIINPC